MKKIYSFIVGLIVFSLLPLIGWGLSDISGFIQNPVRLTFIVMMAALSVIVVLFVPNEGRGYSKGKIVIKRQKFTILFLQIIPLITLLISPYFDHNKIEAFNESSIIRIVGLVLSFIGFFLMNWSIVVLGRQFSVDVTIQEKHLLISSGPYKYIRHPRIWELLFF